MLHLFIKVFILASFLFTMMWVIIIAGMLINPIH